MDSSKNHSCVALLYEMWMLEGKFMAYSSLHSDPTANVLIEWTPTTRPEARSQSWWSQNSKTWLKLTPCSWATQLGFPVSFTPLFHVDFQFPMMSMRWSTSGRISSLKSMRTLGSYSSLILQECTTKLKSSPPQLVGVQRELRLGRVWGNSTNTCKWLSV